MTVSGVERSVASGACAIAGTASPAIHRPNATRRKIDFIGGLLAIEQQGILQQRILAVCAPR